MFIKDWKKDIGDPYTQEENRKLRQENLELKERILALESNAPGNAQQQVQADSPDGPTA